MQTLHSVPLLQGEGWTRGLMAAVTLVQGPHHNPNPSPCRQPHPPLISVPTHPVTPRKSKPDQAYSCPEHGDGFLLYLGWIRIPPYSLECLGDLAPHCSLPLPHTTTTNHSTTLPSGHTKPQPTIYTHPSHVQVRAPETCLHLSAFIMVPPSHLTIYVIACLCCLITHSENRNWV